MAPREDGQHSPDLDRGLETTRGSGAPREDGAPPAVLGGRYLIGELLGSGGMGRVFRAHDRVLGRDVALKILDHAGPGAAGQALYEARAQARVEHPNVCKVYDAGGEAPHRFIAMQLIEGRPLSQFAGELGARELCAIAAAVAEGVHAAHRLGLVHRDLKPSNILVGHDDGGLHPFVTDFGLAADAGLPLASSTGHIVGTPQFMSPEQARGQRILDERSDVYSLGATLYAMLAGRPPFDGPPATVLHEILHADPPPLAGAPRDLATIAGKCLEKDPARRYATAREVADDLHRYLAGLPIQARPPSLAYRARRLVARHRSLAAVIAIAAAALVVSLGLLVSTRLRAAEREELAQRLGQETARVEQVMREGYTLPLHDVRREQARVRARMAQIASSMTGAGRGPGEVALGRAALALHELPEARAHLARAGSRTREAASAAGQVLALQYQEGLAAAERIEDRGARARRKRELVAALRDPALAELRRAHGADGVPGAYLDALIALLEERTGDARALAEAAVAEAPGFYEARRLAGDAEILAATEAARAGRHDEAAAELGRAGEAYAAAIDIGRSDPALREAECARQIALVELAVKQGQLPAERVARARAGCWLAVVADPSLPAPFLDLARLSAAEAGHAMRHGAGPVLALDLGVLAADRAVALAPTDEALAARAKLHRMRGIVLAAAGRDATPSFELARADLMRAIDLAPGYAPTLLQLGELQLFMAMVQGRAGGDPAPGFAASLATLRRALAADPDSLGAARAFANSAWRAAEYARLRKDAAAAFSIFQEAVAVLARARERDPSDFGVAQLLGQLYLGHAREGDDPARWGALAVAVLQDAVRLNPGDPEPYLELAGAQAFMARNEKDPRAGLEQAIATELHAVELSPRNPRIRTSLGGFYFDRARLQREAGEDPAAAVALARAEYDRALAEDPTLFDALADRCDAELLAPTAAELGRCAADLDRALAGTPGYLREELVRVRERLGRQRLAGALPPSLPSGKERLRSRQGDGPARLRGRPPSPGSR